MNSALLHSLLPQARPLRVLYVEDNDDAREQTRKLLENFFDDITVAVDGEDGLHKFEEGEFEIIFTDINMPGLNGLQMLEKIRETDLDAICIVISAHNETEQLNGALTLGVDGYLHKPLNLPALMMSLRKAVKKISLRKERLQRNLLLEREVIAQTNALEKKLYIDDLTGITSRYAFLQ